MKFRLRKKERNLSSKRKPKTDFYLTHGNLKLSKSIIVFTLPSVITCGGSGECRKWCYSQKAEKLFPQVLKARLRNLEATKQPDFESKMIEALKWEVAHGRNILRCHQDGDIFSFQYWERWKNIMRAIPELTMFCYTKSFHLSNLWTNLPDNILLIQSYGSRFDSKIDIKRNTARVINHENEKLPNEYVCPVRPPYKLKCGINCTFCQDKKRKVRHVAFVLH